MKNTLPNAIVQEIWIKSSKDKVMQEVIKWGQAEWWPKNSLMKIDKISSFKGEGARYLQRVKIPYGPRWHTCTQTIRDGYVKRIFLNGMFSPGYEEIELYEQSEEVKLVYSFCFERIKNKLSRFLWKLFFLKLHRKNVGYALINLKNYLEENKSL